MIQSIYSSFIDGQFEEDLGFTAPCFTPLTGEEWTRLSLAREMQVRKAIISAEQAFATWKLVSSSYRSALLRRIAQALEMCADELATVMLMEMGKSLQECKREIEKAAFYFSHFAKESEKVPNLILPIKSSYKILEPIGVVGIFSPWRFPLVEAARKIAAALAAGCTLIVHTSSSITLLAFAAILKEIPKGVVNIIIADDDLAQRLFISSSQVRLVAFTGSIERGQCLLEQGIKTLKQIKLEIGSNSPFIVLEDAPLEQAVEKAVVKRMLGCEHAPGRFLIHKKIYPQFMQMVISKMQRLHIGDPRSLETEISEVLHPWHKEAVERQILDAKEKGAKIEHLGHQLAHPCLIKGITPQMKAFCEETHSPLFPVTTFETLEEAIFLANTGGSRQEAVLFTSNLSTAAMIASALAFQGIRINDAPLEGSEEIPLEMQDYLVAKRLSLKCN